MITANLRQEIDRHIATEEVGAAARLLRELWIAEEPSTSAAAYICSRFEQLRPKLQFLSYRVAILRSFTVEPLIPLLKCGAFLAGIDLTVHLSDFNAYVQEILDGESQLYRFQPDAVILAVQTRDITPELWRDFAGLTPNQVQEIISRVSSDYCDWLRAFRKQSRAHLIMHNLEQPEIPSTGVLDSQSAQSQSQAIQHINNELLKAASKATGVRILDYDALVARYGRIHWHDDRKWLAVRLPIAAHGLNHLVDEWLRFLHPLTGKLAKALAVDLDNVLWGGVIGEDGMGGIRLGSEYPGAAYQEVQRALLDLHRRGILLAICSKNNQDDAMEVLQNHPGMLLEPSHFAAMRINWGEKSQNLREIASELNIGVDSLAFLDDSPFERQQVRSQVPDVLVIELGNDPMEFARTVRECPMFERLSVSVEDQQRGAYYQDQQQREKLENTSASREDFYRSLQQEAEIASLTKATLPRIAQLTNKTNQFNLTTHRYTEQQVSELASLPGWNCFSMQVRDRFGDNGLVGVAITHLQGRTCEIDTLLMSCRVIGRTVESAFLWFLVEHARKHGAERLQGWFLPTKKNAPARDFYPNHQFKVIDQNGEGTLWGLDLAATRISCPEWVRVHVVNGEKA